MTHHPPMFVGADIRELDGAACYSPDATSRLSPDAWSPDGKNDMAPGRAGWEAARVCRGCDVRAECLNQALARDEQHGIWGGFWFGDPEQKRRARDTRLRRRGDDAA